MTKTVGEVWYWAIVRGARVDLLEDLEVGIAYEATREWGDKTRCEFDRESKTIRVTRGVKSELLSWGDE